MRNHFSKVKIALLLYSLILGAAICDAGQTSGKTSVTTAKPSEAQEPGSEGDTLTVEDKRMAYLIYKLLDKNGNIIGANLERGAKLFYQNCRPCHGEDGRRIDFNPMGNPEYIGTRARLDLPTFWHQMNFGDEERNMEAYIDEISIDEMRDIAAYAQTLP
ncbi:MAG: cytochrome c [Fibrobacter sp.]|nr:cytochrome c [Fibrobacter sp.]